MKSKNEEVVCYQKYKLFFKVSNAFNKSKDKITFNCCNPHIKYNVHTYQ